MNDATNTRMIGKAGIFACGCCTNDTPKRERRATKRRERQAWKRAVRMLDTP